AATPTPSQTSTNTTITTTPRRLLRAISSSTVATIRPSGRPFAPGQGFRPGIMTVIITAVVQAPPAPSTRDRLRAAPIEVCADQGYEGARLQDIARAAGLTTGAVYANFRGKAELLFAAIGARAGVELDGLLSGATGADTRSLLERLGDRLPEPRSEPSLLV